MSITAKPIDKCGSCVLYREPLGSTTGFVPATGPTASRVLLLGEAAGEDEVWQAEPFVGRAGTMLNRVLRMNSIDRANLHIFNSLWCRPAHNLLDGTSYEHTAIPHCRSHHWQDALEKWLADSPPGARDKVVVPLGAVPLRWILDFPGGASPRVQDFHGTVSRDPSDRFWVVPTFHPSHIQRGAFNLIGTVSWDLQHAFEVAAKGFEREHLDLVLDPTVEWFEAYVETLLASDPETTWLAVDVETPDKERQTDEGELKSKEARSWHILRVNFSFNKDQGVTVPHVGPYIPLISRILSSERVLVFHNNDYDVKRLRHAGHELQGPIFDTMWMWKRYQSDLPRGLGFISPFFSPRLAPWKHLSHVEPVWYAANDGPRTLRIALALAEKLSQAGLWEIPYYRHTYLIDQYAFRPAEEVGLGVNEERLKGFAADLQAKHERIAKEIQGVVPEEVRIAWATRKAGQGGGLKRQPLLEDGSPEPSVLERRVQETVKLCRACGATQVSVKHRCEDRTLTPQVELSEIEVSRWFRVEDFNPGSSDQMLLYIRHRGHVPKKDKKTKKDSANKDTLAHLIKNTRDPLYPRAREIRVVDKVWKTYAIGTLKKLEEDPRSQVDGRVHASTTHVPSTARTSMTAPNLQNVVADRGAHNPAAGFRNCIEAEAGCYLIEADYNAMEPTETGWHMGDPSYVRLAKLGVHAFITTLAIGKPADLKWSDTDLKECFADIKENHESTYKQVKCAVNGLNNGLTLRGMVMQYPDVFPNEKMARRIQEIYFAAAPRLPQWHVNLREHAAKYRVLGGRIDHTRYNPAPGFHSYGYRHFFYNVLEYKKVKGIAPRGSQVVRIGNQNFTIGLGEDGKRVCAFFQQSVSAGVIKEAMLDLFLPDSPDFIGEEFHGRTPLRALIHDSLLLEVPRARVDYVVEKLRSVMSRAIEEQPCPPEWGMGPHLTIGVDVKVGKNWATYDPMGDPETGRLPNLDGMSKKWDMTKEEQNRPWNFDSATQTPMEVDLHEGSVPIDEWDEDLDELLDEVDFERLRAV